MRRFRNLFNRIKGKGRESDDSGAGPKYEYCPRCNANLTLQKDYDNTLPYWLCKGCGEMLINPAVEADDDIAWICDGCESMLNIQPGFPGDGGKWTCTVCGTVNSITPDQVYPSEEEYLRAKMSPYSGLDEEQIALLSGFEEVGACDGRDDIMLVRDRQTGDLYIRKLLTTYNRSVYEYLRDHPVSHMPQITVVYEGDNCLIVIERYIEGETLETMLSEGPLPEKEAVRIASELCGILCELHGLSVPIVHRDIKPSNVIVDGDGAVWLLDVNVAKWSDPSKSDDTVYMGTKNYAAPEQAGYGLSSSSSKADIYALGVLLNVMLTGAFPKEARPGEPLWCIISECISLDADKRPTASELRDKLEGLL